MSVYQTTLSKRTGSISLSDFNKLNHLWVNSPSDDVPVAGESLAMWNEYIPYTPTQIYELFSSGFASDNALSIHISPNGSTYFDQQEYSGRFQASMTLMLGNKVHLKENNIRVAVGKGQKVGTNAMRIQIETAVALGASKFDILASGANGGYTWFRAGFHFDEDARDFQKKKYEVCARYEARLHAIRDFLSVDDYYDMRELIKLENSDDPMRIANFQSVLDVEEFISFKVENKIRRNLDDFYVRLDDRDFDDISNYDLENISEVFQIAAVNNKATIPLGRYMQVGTTLPAVVDFKNQKQMKQVGEYLGGWKTIGLVQNQPQNVLSVKPA
jgi:hypothetical protein